MPESFNHAEFARLLSIARLHLLSAESAIDLDLGTSTEPRELGSAEQRVAKKQVEKALGDLDIATRCLKLSAGINPEEKPKVIVPPVVESEPEPVAPKIP
jgi:hypothetical protein